MSTELTKKLGDALKKVGRSSAGIDVVQNPDGSIMAMRNGNHLMTLEQGENRAVCFGNSSITKWANKLDTHLSRCSRGDYHEQNRELREYNRARDERRKVNRREEFIHQYGINAEKMRKKTVYFY